MDKEVRVLTTKEKALKLNLDNKFYGSFAEIGAGQEVAANFFKAGGASGSVAKTMSAYDMSFSDAIYGKAERYVCEDRLQRMLDKEFGLLQKRLPERASTTCFFALANTVESLNYHRTNQGQGWMGAKFQVTPNGASNECVIHFILNDNDPILQQQALGILGVNLLYGCWKFEGPEKLITSLVDNLNRGRVEVDMFRINGPNFDYVDNRLLSLKLVKNGLTRAAMFGPDRDVLQPSEALYKKNVLVMRGRFRPPTKVNVDMLASAYRQFKNEKDVSPKDITVITELTLQDLSFGGEIDDQDFLNRADILCSLGQNVMISNYQEHYRLVNYLTRYTRSKKIGIVLGIHNLGRIFDEKFYENINGGILEAFGVLFGGNIKVYVYPAKTNKKGEYFTCKNFKPQPHLDNLFKHLQENGKIEDIESFKPENLHIVSDIALAMIQSGEKGWEKMVPEKVATAIKKNGLFNYPHSPKETPSDDEDFLVKEEVGSNGNPKEEKAEKSNNKSK